MSRFLFRLTTLIVFAVLLETVISHPQCLDFLPPFKPAQTFVMCSEYQSFGCCDSTEDTKLGTNLASVVSKLSKAELSSCLSYLRFLTCQKCSPYAAHLYNTENGMKATSIPGLCTSYCLTMIAQCSSIVKYLTTNPRIILLAETSPKGFCNAVKAPDPDYCYPDLKTNPKLATNLGKVTYYQGAGSCVSLCVKEVANRLYSPVSAKHSGDGTHRLFVVEQRGIIWIFLPDFTQLHPAFLNIRHSVLVNEVSYDERGLLDIAFHPNYKTNGLFYIYYSVQIKNKQFVRISELKVASADMNRANVSTERSILEIEEPAGNHNGGQLLFHDDGLLYIFVGDGGKAGDPFGPHGNGQNKKTLLGKVLRIDINTRGPRGQPYSVPPSNPFVSNSSYLPEIYALGVRNMWRCSMDQGDKNGRNRGRIFCGDVGQNKYEEIDIIRKGANYGWRAFEGFSCYDRSICNRNFVENYEPPIHAYHHSIGKSVTGGYVYRGCQSPNLQGKYIFGDYANGKLFLLQQNASGQWRRRSICMGGASVCKNGGLQSSYSQYILSFGEDEDGEVYMLATTRARAGHRGGSIYKLVDPSRRGNPSICAKEVIPTVLHPRTRKIPFRKDVDTRVKVRLVSNDNKTHQGRVEIMYDGEWGTICDDSWDTNDAHVICRMLGYPRAQTSYNRAKFGKGTGPIWLDEVRCRGYESTITACDRNPWGDSDCSHSEDASVVCKI